MVVSELVASTNGIGYRILTSQIMLLLTDMWCGILLLALLGWALNAVFRQIEHCALHWHRGARQRSRGRVAVDVVLVAMRVDDVRDRQPLFVGARDEHLGCI